MKLISLFFLCAFSATAFANSAKLEVKTFTDYSNDFNTLSKAKTFLVDLAFVEKNNLQFYMFSNGEDEICFTGPAKDAAKIIDAILATSTGDAYVYPEKAKISKDLIKQDVRFEDEGGEHEFTINVSRCK